MVPGPWYRNHELLSLVLTEDCAGRDSQSKKNGIAFPGRGNAQNLMSLSPFWAGVSSLPDIKLKKSHSSL